MNKDYKPINNLWKDSEGYRYFGTLKLSSKIKYDGDDFIPLWEWINQLQQENKILKENAENNDKVVDKVNWENMLLKKENKQIQEELECTIGIVEHNRIISEKNKEIHQLKDNWNDLKKYAKEIISTDNELYGTDLLDKMQELEQGSD